MPRRAAICLTACLLAAATAAQAQMGGGGGHGHRGGGGSPNTGGGTTSTPPPTRLQRETPVNEIEIVGVVKAIAPETDRIIIAYEAVDGLGWPAGTMPFPVAKSALLKGVTVGEKVRFRLDSEQISDLKPY